MAFYPDKVSESMSRTSRALLTNAIAVGPGPWLARDDINTSFAVTASSSATVDIEVSLDGVNTVATVPLTITLAAAGTDGDLISGAWPWVRANVTTLVGTVSVSMGN